MENLGVLPGGTFSYSRAKGVDSTGDIVVGESNSRGDKLRGFGWHRDVGMRNLGVPEGWVSSTANAVSGDGMVAVGTIYKAGRISGWRLADPGTMETIEVLPLETTDNSYSTANSVNYNGTVTVGALGTMSGRFVQTQRATLWIGESTSSPVDLGVLDGGTQSAANAVSGDGSVVVGWSGSEDGKRAFRWTANGGMQNLGVLDGGTQSAANAVSGNGNVIVGMSSIEDGKQRAFRWTANGGMQNLGVLDGGTQSAANAVSGDGSVVVGWSESEDGKRAFRWTASGGMQNLGVLDGGTQSAANAVSGDGNVVVGESGVDPNDPSDVRAFRWTASGGMQNLGVLDGGTR